MKFSIITVCYNSAKTIRRTFNSVLAQDYDDYEYIIVDGASTDGTLEIIKEYEPKFQGRMRWISEPDKGIYDAMNKGFRMANGDLIGFMNSDDVYEPEALRIVAEQKKQIPDAGIYYGISRVLSAQGVEIGVDRRHHSQLKNGCLQHQSCFFANSVYRKYGGYDTTFRLAADYDYTVRLMNGGEVFCPVDRILASFSLSGETGNHAFSAKKEVLLVRRKYGFVSRFHVFLELLNFQIREFASKHLKRK